MSCLVSGHEMATLFTVTELLCCISSLYTTDNVTIHVRACCNMQYALLLVSLSPHASLASSKIETGISFYTLCTQASPQVRLHAGSSITGVTNHYSAAPDHCSAAADYSTEPGYRGVPCCHSCVDLVGAARRRCVVVKQCAWRDELVGRATCSRDERHARLLGAGLRRCHAQLQVRREPVQMGVNLHATEPVYKLKTKRFIIYVKKRK